MKKIGFIALVLAALLTWFFIPMEWKDQLNLKGLQNNLVALKLWVNQNTLFALLGFVLIYVISAALSLPWATLLTLLGGALFGFSTGLVLVLFSATLGATLAMLMARTFLRNWVIARMGQKLQSIQNGFEKEGAFYLFALRLVPVFPFFAVNLLSGLTPLKLRTFFGVSFLGMIPGTAVYVFAGLQLGQLQSLSGIISGPMLLAFSILGLFPFISKRILEKLRARRIYNGFTKPRQFDYNLIAIGAGAGGLVTSYIGAAVGAKVALIEKHKMGGDCLNYGCVPSKALIHAAKVVHSAKKVSEIGKGEFEIDTSKVMDQVRRVIQKVEPHDSVERYTGLGVEVFLGEARIIDPWTVEVNGQKITARSLVLATGAEPFVPAFEGLDLVEWATSDTLWDLNELPKRVLVLGAGPIGCELTQALNRLGSHVTQIERGAQIMGREDADVAQVIESVFKLEGVEVITGHQVVRFGRTAQGECYACYVPVDTPLDVPVDTHLDTQESPLEQQIVFDRVILALGRKARQGFGMEELGIELRTNGSIEANSTLQTNFPNIYVVGDATGPYQFTHFAAHQAWYAALNGLLAPFWSFKADYSVVPWATFVDPQVARVGLSESDAKTQGVHYEISTYHLDDLDRAIADGETQGFVKVLTVPGSDKILGVTIVGAHAGELLAEWTLAIKHGLGLKKIMGTIHAYPTMAESSKYAAGIWAQAHKPQKALVWARQFFAWRRGAK